MWPWQHCGGRHHPGITPKPISKAYRKLSGNASRTSILPLRIDSNLKSSSNDTENFTSTSRHSRMLLAGIQTRAQPDHCVDGFQPEACGNDDLKPSWQVNPLVPLENP
jgi:hypothetical protein